MTDILRITAICASLLLLMSCQERVDHNPAATSSEPEVFVGYEGITNRLILRNGLFYKPFETEPFSGRYEDRTDGYLAWEQTYEKGVPVGVRRSWYQNGQIKSEGLYSHSESIKISFIFMSGVINHKKTKILLIF